MRMRLRNTVLWTEADATRIVFLGSGSGVGATTRILLLPRSDVLPGPSRPEGQFSCSRLRNLTRDVQRGKVLRPMAIHEEASNGGIGFRLITNRHELHTTELIKLAGVPTVRASTSRGDSTILSLVRGLRQRSLGFFRRTRTIRELIRGCSVDHRRTTSGLNETRSALSGGLELLQLPRRVQCAVRGTKLARHRTETLLALRGSIRHRETLRVVASQRLGIRRDRHLVRRVLGHEGGGGPVGNVHSVEIFVGALGRTMRTVHETNVSTSTTGDRARRCIRCAIHVPGVRRVEVSLPKSNRTI